MGLDEAVVDLVGVDGFGAEFGQVRHDQAFAAGDVAGDADDEWPVAHRRPMSGVKIL